MNRDRFKWRLSYDQRILFLALLVGLPGTIAAATLLWIGSYPFAVQVLLSLLLGGFWWAAAAVLRKRVVYPLRTVANLIGALSKGDFSLRGRITSGAGALDEVYCEINSLVEMLREQRLGAVEATALLRTVMAEIEVAIFAFDSGQRLQLVNRAGERLLAAPAKELLGETAHNLHLDEHLDCEVPCTRKVSFPGGSGRWGIRRTTFREQGRSHRLLVISDLSRELREEELQAWQRLVRVLGHELNNSLAPIQSIAGSLQGLVDRDPPDTEWKTDLQRGLEVIASRAESLGRFLNAYATLARLPKPRLETVSLPELVERVVRLETRIFVKTVPGPDVPLQADRDQLEQVLINLVRNAVDAVLELATPETAPLANGAVSIGWIQSAHDLEIRIKDEGPGLPNSANLFVPFFTTKPDGTGIGLVLCRQIAEAHGGNLMLENRPDGHGCIARLTLRSGYQSHPGGAGTKSRS